jgi:hypothetical protein
LIILAAPGMTLLAVVALTLAIAALLLRCSYVGRSEMHRNGRSHIIVPDGLRAPARRRALIGAFPAR